jgi:serine/threonine-protein kinase RsbW
MKRNQYILYGLDKYKEVIDEIITEFDISYDSFDVKLILTEALTNAFSHGNNKNADKIELKKNVLIIQKNINHH